MTPEQRRQIKEINRMSEMRFGKKASSEKFAWRNQQREELGLEREKSTRGGVAGVWDRNKEVIKPIATGLAGMVPGIGLPLAAGLGAAMGGLDREGKGGIGFDVKQGVKGGLAGATAGAAGAGVKGLFTGAKGLAGAVEGVKAYGRQMPGMGGGGAQPSAGGDVLGSLGDRAALGLPEVGGAAAKQAAGGTAKSLLTGAGSFMKNNASWMGPAATAGATVLGQRAETQVAQDRLDLERERDEQERRRRENIAQLLMPYFQQQFPGGMPRT